jgi:hypothetical protein
MNEALNPPGGDSVPDSAPDPAPLMTPEQRAADAWARWQSRHTPAAAPEHAAAPEAIYPKLSEPPLLFDIDLTDLL